MGVMLNNLSENQATVQQWLDTVKTRKIELDPFADINETYILLLAIQATHTLLQAHLNKCIKNGTCDSIEYLKRMIVESCISAEVNNHDYQLITKLFEWDSTMLTFPIVVTELEQSTQQKHTLRTDFKLEFDHWLSTLHGKINAQNPTKELRAVCTAITHRLKERFLDITIHKYDRSTLEDIYEHRKSYFAEYLSSLLNNTIEENGYKTNFSQFLTKENEEIINSIFEYSVVEKEMVEA